MDFTIRVEIPSILTNWAIITAQKVKIICVIFSCNQIPTELLKKINKVAPSAAGDKIKGNSKNKSIKFLPKKLYLDKA